jgi:hypothetical protein
VKYGDQKYLDDWPVRFENVVVFQHKGIGFAPWNLSQYMIARKGEQTWVDDVPLVLYHFHNFRMLTKNAFAPRIHEYTGGYVANVLNQNHIQYIYHPYASRLKDYMRRGYIYGLFEIPRAMILRMILKGNAFLVEPRGIALFISKIALMLRKKTSSLRRFYAARGET